MESPDIARIMHACAAGNLHIGGDDTTYYTADPSIVPKRRGAWHAWRRNFYVFLKRNSRPLASILGIPPDAHATLGIEVPM